MKGRTARAVGVCAGAGELVGLTSASLVVEFAGGVWVKQTRGEEWKEATMEEGRSGPHSAMQVIGQLGEWAGVLPSAVLMMG